MGCRVVHFLPCVSQDGQLFGYHIHMSDSEKSIDAYVMKERKYGVAYKGDSSVINLDAI